jgi:mono/diheme cytochrome c family protein
MTADIQIAAILIAMLAGSLAGAEQGAALPATTPRRGGNPAAAKVTNPVALTADSVAEGRRTYQRLCSRCHGAEGRGDGGGAGAGGQPADLTDSQWDFGGSDGEIFHAIREGTSADMESYSERIRDTEIWNLVNFIRSIGPENVRK